MAGAPPPTTTIERTEVELGWEFVQIYGLTETAPLITINRNRHEYDDLSPTERARQLARAGAPSIGTTMAVDPRARSWRAATRSWPGTGSSRTKPRWRFSDGFFHTGDGGIIDDDNYVVISDRKKDVIISGGENVSSIEVEDALFQHPEITEVAVIGIPDEKWGELVTALVVTTPAATSLKLDVIAFCEGTARRLQVPEEDRVPRRTGPHSNRQAPEVQAPRTLLGRRRREQINCTRTTWCLDTKSSTRGWRRWCCGHRSCRTAEATHSARSTR